MFPINTLGGSIHLFAVLLGGLLWLVAPIVGICQERKAEKGTVRYIGEVIIVGNTSTPDILIREQLDLFPGQVLRYPELKTAERNLERLGCFEIDAQKGVRPTVQALDNDGPFQDILVKVQERSGKRLHVAKLELKAFCRTGDTGRLFNAAKSVRDALRQRRAP